MSGPEELQEIKARRSTPHPFLTTEQIDWLVAEVDRQRDLLRRLEWAAGISWQDEPCCPACKQAKEFGLHMPDCWLAAELPDQDEPDPQRHRPERA